MKVNVRKLNTADKKEMLALRKEFCVFNRKEMLSDEINVFMALSDLDKFVRAEFKRALGHITFVAVLEEKIVGFIEGSLFVDEGKVFEKQGTIEQFFVTEEYRHKGIGMLLFNRLLKEFKSKGCKMIETSSYGDNKKAIQFYKDLGFIKYYVGFVKEIE